ncbi:hypothetical protein ACLQ29_18535 [Micromonospora sp. DT228]|uniref:hypothetical protein n=1 Tax=Micromonospora sp. DT228 TaxID=3393443 RepID=UPI003CF946D4
MSERVEYFVAPSDEAAGAVHARGPKRQPQSYRTVSGASFDADDAAAAWEELLIGATRPGGVTSSEPRMVADFVNDGSAVFVLSDDVVTSLARAELPRLREVAEAWRADLLQDGADIDADTTLGLLVGVAELAREAVSSGQRVYCWVSG